MLARISTNCFLIPVKSFGVSVSRCLLSERFFSPADDHKVLVRLSVGVRVHSTGSGVVDLLSQSVPASCRQSGFCFQVRCEH